MRMPQSPPVTSDLLTETCHSPERVFLLIQKLTGEPSEGDPLA
jgi:hypothetical protein